MQAQESEPARRNPCAEAAGAGVALNRIGLPDDMAGAVVYFASSASSFVTGQTLIMDGGGIL